MHEGVDRTELAVPGRAIERHDDAGNRTLPETDANEVAGQKVKAVRDDVAERARGPANAGEDGDLRVAHAQLALVVGLGAAIDEPLAERVQRRRHDEYGQRLGQHRLDLPHSLRLRLDDDDPVAAERVCEGVLADTFEVAVDHRPFEEIPGLDLRAELLRLVEVIVDAVLLAAARLAAGGGHVDHGVVELLDQTVDDRVLPGTGWRRNNHEEAATIDAQRRSSRSGPAVTGVPSPSRYATSSGASGAVKVRSPACGSRTVRRQACRNWRSRPPCSPRLPYTGSPTIGSRAYARCARI